LQHKLFGEEIMNISVIGSGSWGVALAIYLAKLGNSVKIWSFAENEKNAINNERKCIFLPNITIPENVYCSLDFEEVLEDTEVVFLVTPSKFIRDTVKKFKTFVKPNQGLVICSKGFESGSLKSLAVVVKEELPNNEVGVLSGPSHAEEVAAGIPTALVIASESEGLRTKVQGSFSSDILRIYTSSDVIGVEVGGAFKNIIAFCAGVSYGMNLGDNSFAALATRGLFEIQKLGIKMGAESETFYGLTGLGDLIVTCSSVHSRNRKAGKLIAEGKTMEETKAEVGMVIESFDNIEIAHDLAKKYEVEMPLTEVAYNILHNSLSPKAAVDVLMTRDLKSE
jgi:glycerol-3-phosphate dehydrogenase (NAD(P)+)